MNEIKYFFKLERKLYSSQNPLIIAELGTSHNGEIAKAKRMIDSAAEAGADCVKFQMVYADEILHPDTGVVPLPGGNIRLYDKFKALEMPPEFYLDIKEYTESKGILFLCTPFGMKSASILRKMQPKMIKIASPELNYTGLLEEIAKWGVPALISSGVSTLADIETAVNLFKGSMEPEIGNMDFNLNENKNPQVSSNSICLLHCVTSYPAPETEYNLRLLPNLAAIFGVSTGVSDHSSDPQLVPSLAVSMGASVVEKHFCLSKADPGLDDPIALPPDEFSKMVKAVKQAVKDRAQETIARFSRERGCALIEKILGNGIKKMADSEKANYRLTNRSIHALHDIKKGETIKKDDYAVLRTEKVLRPGLEPCWENLIEGRAAKNDIPSGEGIRFEDI
ncbi:MAG: N-acetylneuraminate synthase family protein [Treponema sp.]|nr:N-acetylneuraminate synthase family protein [Treponema sp.]